MSSHYLNARRSGFMRQALPAGEKNPSLGYSLLMRAGGRRSRVGTRFRFSAPYCCLVVEATTGDVGSLSNWVEL